MIPGTAVPLRSGHSRENELANRVNSELLPREAMWRRLVFFSAIFAVGWVAALAFHGLIATIYYDHWPQNTFLFKPSYRYADLTLTWDQSRGQNPYTNNGTAYGGTYFPFAYFVFRSVGLSTHAQMIVGYIVLVFASIAGIWAWWLNRQREFWRGDARWPVVALLSFFIVVCNYPTLFAVDRGNIDPLAMCLVYVALEFVRRRYASVGGVILAVGAAFKAFPFAALLFLLHRRRLAAATLAIVTMVALVVLPALAFEGELLNTLRAFKQNMSEFRAQYVIGAQSAHYSSDALNAFRVLGRWRGEWFSMTPVVYWYEKATLGVAAVTAILALFVIQETWRELLAIALIMLVFPNIANDYKLVFLLPALLEWLTSTARGWRNAVFGLTAALLMVPKHFYFPHGDEASISCLISPILIGIMASVLWPTADEIARIRWQADRMLQRCRALTSSAQTL